MDECTLYERVLDLRSPWFVELVEIGEDEAVNVSVALDEDAPLICPKCSKTVPRYDKRRRRWRHLDTCQFKTFVSADVPRIECPEHGHLTVSVPWAEERSRYTMLFEVFVIDWLQDASVSAVQRRLSISWNAVDGIMQRAVVRGLSRRKTRSMHDLCVDETSFQKRHEYVTVVSNQAGEVLYVADGKGKESLRPFYKKLRKKQKESIRSISMDMSPAYIHVTKEEIPNADKRIALDRFHITQFITKAVDVVRQQELRSIQQLRKSRYLWLKNPKSLAYKQKLYLSRLRQTALKTGKAWSIKEMASSLWNYSSRTWAYKAWRRWYDWAIRCRLQPMRIAARQIKDNLWGIINAVVLGVTNGTAESVNSKIKMLKVKSRGFRNRERFKTAILFHCGGLDLYPNPL